MALAVFLLSLVAAPLMIGIVNRVKAFYAGRQGPPLLQPYYDLRKLLAKGAVYSTTTTWLFAFGPCLSLAALATALAMTPLGPFSALVAFPGDLLLVAFLLAAARFFMIVAALDTGSSFEGMGASREAFFAALLEPALFLTFAVLSRGAGSLSLSGVITAHSLHALAADPAPWLLSAAAFFVLFLAENCRVPVDDPNTHLELTMIHEVMVLDHSGPDFAFIQYGASLKFWLLSAVLAGILFPVRTGVVWLDLAAACAAQAAVAIGVGVIESVMARLRMIRVQQFLVAATVLSAIALGLLLR